MFKLFSTLLALTVGVLALPQHAPVQLVERGVAPPDSFNITSIGVNGSGCPAGTAHYVLNSDKTAVHIHFSNFYAAVGPGIAVSDNRKSCQITLGLHVPAGFSFTIGSVAWNGWYHLDAGVTGYQQAEYYFQAQAENAVAKNNLSGPVIAAAYTYQNNFQLTGNSACGDTSVLNIVSSLQVDNGNYSSRFGYISDNSASADFQEIFGFTWSTCY